MSDAAAWCVFDAGLSRESHRRFFPHKYDDATLAKALARAARGDDLLLGVFDVPRMVGYFFMWYMCEDIPLLGIGITDEFQHRGLGRQMMAILLDRAKAAKKNGVDLTTMPDNDVAFTLYRKMGFAYYADVENQTGDGTIVVERAMFYPIAPGARPPHGKQHGPPV